MQRERIVSMMNTECEQEVEQDKREKSWTNTGRFKPADLSPLLKGEIKCYCGVFVAVVECVWVCMPLRHLMLCIRSSQGGIQDFHLDFSISCLQVSGANGGYAVITVKFISNLF